MPQATCINHPTRLGSARCKRCGRPICSDCKMVSEVGVVCSQQCLDAIKAFQERVKEDVPGRKKRTVLGRILGLDARTAIRLAVVLIVVAIVVMYGILCVRSERLVSPPEFFRYLSHWVQGL